MTIVESPASVISGMPTPRMDSPAPASGKVTWYQSVSESRGSLPSTIVRPSGMIVPSSVASAQTSPTSSSTQGGPVSG